MLGSSHQEEPMKPSQHTTEQIIKILEQAEKGEQTVGSVCREHGITETTFYRWRRAFGRAAQAATPATKRELALPRLLCAHRDQPIKHIDRERTADELAIDQKRWRSQDAAQLRLFGLIKRRLLSLWIIKAALEADRIKRDSVGKIHHRQPVTLWHTAPLIKVCREQQIMHLPEFALRRSAAACNCCDHR